MTEPNALEKIDHLVFTAPTLDEGMNLIEKILGVRPVYGGQHPKWGTHNALLSIGDKTYLEVISPDPSLPQVKHGFLPQNAFQGGTKLTTWVIRTNTIEKDCLKAMAHGISLGPITSGSRKRNDGTVLSWRLTDPIAFPLSGAIPFLIDWGTSPHPAGSLPQAGILTDLMIEHPQSDLVGQQLKVIGCDMITKRADKVKLTATIETSKSPVILY